MKTLPEILAELQALESTEVSVLEAAIEQTVEDLQALVNATPVGPGAADPIVSITTTTQSGVTAEFVPQPAQTS